MWKGVELHPESLVLRDPAIEKRHKLIEPNTVARDKSKPAMEMDLKKMNYSQGSVAKIVNIENQDKVTFQKISDWNITKNLVFNLFKNELCPIMF